MCLECINKANKPIVIFGESDYERMINGIIQGSITTSSLDYESYKKTAEALTEALVSGLGYSADDVQYMSEKYTQFDLMRTNVYYFSGAKSYQQVREVSSQLGNIFNKGQSISDFKKEAMKILVNYNENYLTTEYNFAISQGLSASKWNEIEAGSKQFPYLTYHTVGDGRVRPEHASLDGITRPVNDKFWSKYYPPNGWNCRCTVMQDSEGDVTPLKDIKVENVPPLFQMNAGKDKIVFSKKHPYFKVATDDKDLARVNWNLPIP